MNAIPRFLAGACLGAVASVSQANVMHRLYVADLSDFGKKLGFYVDFENEAADGHPCRLDTLKTFLGVADGKGWRFLSPGVKFSLGQLAHLSATISPTNATFSVDGINVSSAGGFKAGPTNATAASVPGWASGSTEYRLVQKSLTITVGSSVQTFSFIGSGLSPVLSLFENSLPVVKPVPISPGQAISVEATVQIEPLVDVNSYKPLIDPYGQLVQAAFAGKILRDGDLKAAFKADDRQLAEWKPRTDVDKFGGELKVTWKSRGTGFYRTFKHDGTWWLLTPQGNPVFYTGVCTAPSLQWDSTPVTGRQDLFTQLPPKTGITPSLWARDVWGANGGEQAAIHALNLIRRFGTANYDAKGKDECRRRLAAWGFSGLGKWSSGLADTPVLPVLGCPDVPKLDRHFDVFDTEIVARMKASLTKQIGGNLHNPYIVGYSFGNEYDEIVTASEIEKILASKSGSAAKSAFISYGVSHLYKGDDSKLRAAWGGSPTNFLGWEPLKASASDVESLRRFYASKYYQTLYTTIKSIDPNHLYFGFWIVPGWWVSDEDWNLIAPYVDVIGFDRYSDWPGIENLLGRFDKPVLLGEFSFPSWYGGTRGFGRYSVYTESDAESGKRYADLVAAAARCRQCVGSLWFQYRDEPITGRGPAIDTSVAAGEHYAFGLIDACDLPKYDLVRAVRKANLAANGVRLKIST